LIADTHALLWWWIDSPRLTRAADDVLGDLDNTIFVSAVSVYELSAKLKMGKLPEADAVIERLSDLMARSSFAPLAISHAHARTAGLLPGPHRDPFDRFLIAQAMVEGASIVSADPVFAHYGVPVIW
jgi:PIN domain nuclease of toxin-antitoxin system